MKRSLIALAVAALLGQSFAATRDVSYTYRMGAGFPGDVNRTHPASILPVINDPTTPIRLYGDPGIYNASANTIRGFTTGDTALTRIDGIIVRPFPIQQTSGGPNASFGVGAAPGGNSVIDVVRQGFVIVNCYNFAVSPPAKGGTVYVWVAASSGQHVQGGLEAAVSAGNTATISNARWNGPADSSGYAELEIWAA